MRLRFLLMLTMSIATNAFSDPTFKVVSDISNVEWKTLTDNDARGPGSASKVLDLQSDYGGNSLYALLRLGERAGAAGKVGFARIYTELKTIDLTDFEGLWIPLAVSDPSIKISIILDDDLEDEDTYRIDFYHRYSNRPRLGAERSGGTWVSFSELKSQRRGRPSSKTIDLEHVNYFAIQLTRSIQKDDIFNNKSFLDQSVFLWSSIIALKSMDSIVEPIAFSVTEKVSDMLDKKKSKAAAFFGNEYVQLEQGIARVLQIIPESTGYESDFLRRIIRPRLENSGVILSTTSGENIARPVFISREKNLLRLQVLHQLQTIARKPEVIKSWLHAFLLDLAMFTGLSSMDSEGNFQVTSKKFEEFVQKKTNYCQVNMVRKDQVFLREDGTLGLSVDLIEALTTSQDMPFGNNIFIENSSFADVVGKFSFPILFLFYSELVNGKPCSSFPSNEKPMFTRFYSSILGFGEPNATGGWRLWQKVFAGTGSSMFVDPAFWMQTYQPFISDLDR